MKLKTQNPVLSKAEGLKLKTLYCLLPAVFCLIIGCQPSQQVAQSPSSDIAGTWKSTGEKVWQFVLEEDSSVSEVFHPNGVHMILSEDGQTKEISPGISEHYIYGPCKWLYDQDSNDLSVTVSYEKILIRDDGAKIQRTLTEQFSGTVSQNSKEWNPEWTRKTKLSLPIPEHISEPVPFEFKKVKEKQ